MAKHKSNIPAWITELVSKETRKIASSKKAWESDPRGQENWPEESSYDEQSRLNADEDLADTFDPTETEDEDGYLVSKTYEVVTQESASEGDADARGYVFQDEVMDRSDVVREIKSGGYIEGSSSSLAMLRWITTESEQDFSTGDDTTYSLHIRHIDGSEIDGEEWRELLTEAGILNNLHVSSTKIANEDIKVDTWFERDRASVVVYVNGQEVAEWWDAEVSEAVEDGFLDPRDWEGSAIQYCREHGLIHNGSAVPNTVTADSDHAQDPGYSQALDKGDPQKNKAYDPATDSRYAAKKKKEDEPEKKKREERMEDKDDIKSPYDGYAKKTKPKKASELKIDECGTPPNTERATQEHDFEIKALAKELASMMKSSEWSPNDPLKD